MKAWNDLMESVSVYRTGLDEEPTSYWYLDHGVKIEMFTDDGRIELKNVMVAGDHYKDITDEERAVFETDGWLKGCYTVCINTYSRRMAKVDYLLSLRKNNDTMTLELKERKADIQKKLDRYFEMMNNLSIFANK